MHKWLNGVGANSEAAINTNIEYDLNSQINYRKLHVGENSSEVWNLSNFNYVFYTLQYLQLQLTFRYIAELYAIFHFETNIYLNLYSLFIKSNVEFQSTSLIGTAVKCLKT